MSAIFRKALTLASWMQAMPTATPSYPEETLPLTTFAGVVVFSAIESEPA